MRYDNWCSIPFIIGLSAAPGCSPGEPDASPDAGVEDATSTTRDPADGGPDGSPGSSGTASSPGDINGLGDDSSGGLDLDALYGCEEPDLLELQGFSGPGIDPDSGRFIGPAGGAYVVHTTQLMLHPDPDSTSRFLELSGPVFAQLAESEGMLGYALAYEPNCDFYRTMGIWRSEEAMLDFVTSGAHAMVMLESLRISLTGRNHHWEVPASELPISWSDAVEAVSGETPYWPPQ